MAIDDVDKRIRARKAEAHVQGYAAGERRIFARPPGFSLWSEQEQDAWRRGNDQATFERFTREGRRDNYD